jgi:hypothetical protein
MNLLYHRAIFRHLPASWRAYLLRRSNRQLTQAMQKLGISAAKATEALNAVIDNRSDR